MTKKTQLLKRLDRLEQDVDKIENPKIDVKIQETRVEFLKSKITYHPSLTHKIFHNDNSKVKIVVGPFGSGKTSAMIAEIIMRAAKMPVCKDNIRRCKVLVIRNTFKELKTTCLASWLDWCGELGEVYSYNQSPMFYNHQFRDDQGLIDLTIHFLSIDTEKQLRDLKSFEATFVWLSEVSELDSLVLKYVLGRIGRYPKKNILKQQDEQYWSGILGDTNAPKQRHWIPKIESKGWCETSENDASRHQIYKSELKYLFESKEHIVTTKIYHQPPALLLNDQKQYKSNPYAENIKHLSGGYQYYFNMLQNGEEYIRVYVQGKYGTIRSGQKVFEKYNDDIHSVENIEIEKNVEIIYGVDYGRVAPAIIVCKFVAGQLRAIKEFCGEHIYISDLATEQLIPWLEKNAPRTNDMHRKIRAKGVDDCAQTDDGRTQLLDLNLDIRAARTNRIEPRLAAVNQLLGKISSSGFVSLLISRIGCPYLREGFNSAYILEETRKDGEIYYKEKPKKTHPHSDVHDAFQYVALEFAILEEHTKEINSAYFMKKPKSVWI